MLKKIVIAKSHMCVVEMGFVFGVKGTRSPKLEVGFFEDLKNSKATGYLKTIRASRFLGRSIDFTSEVVSILYIFGHRGGVCKLGFKCFNVNLLLQVLFFRTGVVFSDIRVLGFENCIVVHLRAQRKPKSLI